MQLKIRIVDAKFLQFTYEGHILVLVPTGGDLLKKLLLWYQKEKIYHVQLYPCKSVRVVRL